MAAAKGNKYAIGNNGGRPPIFKDANALGKKVDEYFEYIKGEFIEQKKGRKTTRVWLRDPEPATITGLVLFLGFASRSSLDDYEKDEVFSYIIKRARARVEHEYEKRLLSDKATGSIFALKNMGWKDRHHNSIDFDSMSDAELDLIINKILKANEEATGSANDT